MLIWKVSAKLCSEHILWGNGVDSFKADYMSAQANYLSSSQTQWCRIAAGRMSNPFVNIMTWMEMGDYKSFYCYFCYSPSFEVCKMLQLYKELLALVAIALFPVFPIHSNMLSFGLCPYIVCRRWLKICLCCCEK